MTELPAIVLGCHKIGLGVIRALGRMRVPVVGVSYSKMDMGCASKHLVEHHWCPHPDVDPEGFLSVLNALSHRWNGSVLIPSDDATLIPVSKHKQELTSLFRVATEDWSVVEKCVVKKYTYALAEQIGVQCPRTRICMTGEEARDFARLVGFPCLLKPTVGHSFFERFRQKMFFVNNVRELERLYAQLNEERIEVMLQEYIPGDDRCGVNYNSFFAKGKRLIEVMAQKDRLSPPRIGFPRVVISKRLPELSSPAARFLEALGYSGFSCMEFKKDARDGKYRLMEINARLNLSTPLSVMAGVNFPYLLYRYTANGELPCPINMFREGVYWIDLSKDIWESVRSYRRERFPVLDYVRPYIKPHVFDILASDDVGPTIKRCRNMVNEGLKRFFRSMFRKGPSKGSNR